MKRTNLENWIEKTEQMPQLTRQALEKLQLMRLNQTLARMKAAEGFYRDYPEKLESLSELQKLPFTTARDLSDHPEKFLLTSQSEVCRVISGATSGTTGQAKRVFYTANDTEHTVGFFASGISEMLRPGEKCFIAFPFSGAFGLGDLIAQAVQRLGGIPVAAGFGEPFGVMLDRIRQTQPETFIGFPVTLLSLSRMYGKNFPVKRALVSGDACPAGVMAELEKILGSKLYPHYGSRECGLGGGVTCPAFEGMHLRENHIIAEIIDEKGNVLPQGQYGELVLTTIGADAMPLIRYRTGDYTRILPACRCGGVTKRIDMVSRGKDALTMEALDSLLFPIADLVDYKAAFDGKLQIHCLSREKVAQAVADVVRRYDPHLEIRVFEETVTRAHRPAYAGKRYFAPL